MSRISREDVSIIIMSSLLLLEAIKLWLQVVMFRGRRAPPSPLLPPPQDVLPVRCPKVLRANHCAAPRQLSAMPLCL